MNNFRKPLLGIAAMLLAAGASMAQAEVRITEFSPWSSGSSGSPYGADWFELTNVGSSAVDISAWSMDDDSANAGVALLTGISQIGAGQSVIFLEGTGSANTSFISTWFGANAPAGFAIGNYAGAGIGLSTGGDQVNIFDKLGVLQAKVSFGGSTRGQTFDNAAGLNNAVVSQLSMVGNNGAFMNASGEIGSPGAIAAAVPEPETYAMLLAGLALVGAVARRRRQS
ncbi:MAG TPA: lamin tail domain-containing protein [Burkholderiaceae bacterium]|nr:lamin tail domain-containing protein [Burkholderiaceae bacterium]